MDVIKLQILLIHPLPADELAKVEEQLATMGATVTARGAITLSATIPVERYQAAFGQPFTGSVGFAADPMAAATLPVPEVLKKHVESISQTPAHIRMSNNGEKT